MIKGYKCFNKNLINRYGFQFEVGGIYSVNGEVKYGNNGNGFHMCVNLEDTLRFFDGFNGEIDICKVIGFGKCILSIDTHYDYYDMYSVEKLQIIKKLSREEIIKIGLNLPEYRVTRFIQGLKLMEEEIELFKTKFANSKSVLEVISYYKKVI